MTKKIRAARGAHPRGAILQLAEKLHAGWAQGEYVPGSCLYWTMAVIEAAAQRGLRLIPQAGTAVFRRLPPHLDDGAETTLTHFSYVWQPGSGGSLMVLPGGRAVLPEMHVWAADPARGEIVDLSTRHVAEMCRETTGMEWLEEPPPPFLWARELPAGWSYVPDREATAFAVRCMMAELAERKAGGG